MKSSHINHALALAGFCAAAAMWHYELPAFAGVVFVLSVLDFILGNVDRWEDN